MTLYIREYNTGKIHRRKVANISCRYRVEGRYLVVRDYYSNRALNKFDISKYGSIEFWME